MAAGGRGRLFAMRAPPPLCLGAGRRLSCTAIKRSLRAPDRSPTTATAMAMAVAVARAGGELRGVRSFSGGPAEEARAAGMARVLADEPLRVRSRKRGPGVDELGKKRAQRRSFFEALRPEQRWHLAVLLGGGMMVDLGVGLIVPVLPIFANELGLGASGVGLILSAPFASKVRANRTRRPPACPHRTSAGRVEPPSRSLPPSTPSDLAFPRCCSTSRWAP
jgi:hypothetical protein